MAESSSKKQSAASVLSDDLVIDILSRVPYRSLCRFKGVSKSWLALCSDPDLRRKSAQTLSGFFHNSIVSEGHGPYARHFTNLSGRGRPMIDPSLSFLPSYTYAEFIDCCNGLLLLECWKLSSELESEYVVCNPATEKWIVLPHTEGMRRPNITRLGFHAAVSSHFCVFLLNDDQPNGDMHNWNGYIEVTGVEIYSSETGGWTYRQSDWTDDGRGLEVRVPGSSVFFNCTLHLTTCDSSVVTVDVVGKTWRIIPTPHNFHFIGLSQGRLYSARMDYYDGPPLSFWILQDYVFFF